MGSYVGVIGMGVMGQSLALNIANHGYTVSVYNRHGEATKDFMESRVKTQKDKVTAVYELKDFVDSLEAPRKVILMVKAGPVVDAVVDSLLPFLSEGDIVIDAGNSYYKDTSRRMADYAKKGISFFGMGVSGGEKAPSSDRPSCPVATKSFMTTTSVSC